MLEPSHTVFIAAIAGAFGAKGEIKIKSFTQDPAACLEYAPFVDEVGKEILKISKPRVIKGGFAVRSPGIQYRDQAEALRGTKLYCLRSQLRKPEEDEFYHSDLVGLQVQSAEGQILGQITAIHNFGASDLLEITGTPDVAEDWTLPFTLAHVPTVDIAAKTVIIADWQRFLPEAKAQKKPRDHDA